MLEIALALSIGVPVAVAFAATFPSRAVVGKPPAGFLDSRLLE